LIAPIKAWYRRLAEEEKKILGKKTHVPHSMQMEALKKKIVPVFEEEKIAPTLLTEEVEKIKGKKITVVPILRAGLGMMHGVLDLIPSARVSVVGMYRNEETLEPVVYYEKMTSNMQDRIALILDPMLATGGTLAATVDLLKRDGCRSIKGLFLVAAPEGIRRLEKSHPDVEVYTAAIDKRLNETGYILPGLGDAGDKIFGTK